MAESSISVDDSERLVRRVHHLLRVQQVQDNGVAQVRDEDCDDNVETAIKTTFKRRLQACLTTLFNVGNFSQRRGREKRRQKLVVEKPDRGQDGQPVEEGQVSG